MMPQSDDCPPDCASNCSSCLAGLLPFADCDLEVLNVKTLIGDIENYIRANNIIDDADNQEN